MCVPNHKFLESTLIRFSDLLIDASSKIDQSTDASMLSMSQRLNGVLNSYDSGNIMEITREANKMKQQTDNEIETASIFQKSGINAVEKMEKLNFIIFCSCNFKISCTNMYKHSFVFSMFNDDINSSGSTFNNQSEEFSKDSATLFEDVYKELENLDKVNDGLRCFTTDF